jgi:hypothetical protein
MGGWLIGGLDLLASITGWLLRATRPLCRLTSMRAAMAIYVKHALLLGTHILLYAYDTSSGHHETCRAWLESVLNVRLNQFVPAARCMKFGR